jgi:hypothetical protein
MGLLANEEVWSFISVLTRDSRRRWCAVSYVTEASILHLGLGDRLVVDASNSTVTGGATSARELKRLLDLGVSIHSVQKLHSKMYLLGDDLVVGSCNLSFSSQKTMIEIAFHTSDQSEVRAAEDVFEKLVAGGEPINSEFIERILRLPVNQPSIANTSSAEPERLWRLEKPPSNALSREMKCYMQALFEAQLGSLREGVQFRLWPGPSGSEAFRAHMLPVADRLRGNRGVYTLTSQGVAHFEKRKTDPALVGQFLAAILSGDSQHLPETIEHRNLVSL